MLELLKLPGMGPKTVALFWDAAKIASIDQLAEAIEAGRLDGLPRMGAKQIEKLRKGIEDYRRSAGRFRIDVAEEAAARIAAYLLAFDGIEKVTPAGSLRRGRETVGDLDLLVTGPACAPEHTAAAVEYVAAYPGIHEHHRQGRKQGELPPRTADCRWTCACCPPPAYGAALQYFTGSKAHNVSLRQRALKMGYTLSEWALARLDDELHRRRRHRRGDLRRARAWTGCRPRCAKTWARSRLPPTTPCPASSKLDDIRGDVHMHTTASDGRNSIREMAEAALARGYQYIAITDHSKNLAMTNGLDEKRALEHIARIREVDKQMEGRIRVFTGIEVDILADGALDLDDEVLAQMDVVIASVHTRFEQSREEMTARVLRAIENPYVRILGHPTGRLLLRREPFAIDMRRGAPARRRTGRGRRAQRRPRAPRPQRPRPAPGQGDWAARSSSTPTPTTPAVLAKWNTASASSRAPGSTPTTSSTPSPAEFLAALRPRF